ncbi:hypothetical protein C8A00DRAFT_40144 [Chaetomidium leptoderma]|uniref:Uncharacterized protein n=1 Tax=Chaetomidium leptoderma TaxID=669021 RepID=A0AAN6VUA8_9PEZI|nr:hypothetical protein C8A00DRAFT_40144 [Chaetomidium leptoderma]
MSARNRKVQAEVNCPSSRLMMISMDAAKLVKSGAAWGKVLVLANAILFIVAISVNVWTFRRFGLCENLATFSPMRFDAELGAQSVYKGSPRKDLDDAWNTLTDCNLANLPSEPMILADEEILRSFDPTTKPSKGKAGHYYATVEVFHQLHCLDIIRKFIWRDHYGHRHLLRQVLMCNSDVGLIFYTDVGSRQPVARVSTTHMCRNFSQISEWVNNHDSEQGILVDAKREPM